MTLWIAPMSDYGIPGLDAPVGHMISAFVGIVLCVGAAYLYGKVIARKEDSDQ